MAVAAPSHPAGPPLLNQLEAGQTLILGGRGSQVDPVALEIGRLLDLHALEFESCEPEVEVRLGVLKTGTKDRKERMALPCVSEAILPPRDRNSGYHYSFVPGLPPGDFVSLTHKIDVMCSDVTPPERRVECGRKWQHTVDEIYRCGSKRDNAGVEPAQFRVTRDITPQANEVTAAIQEAGQETSTPERPTTTRLKRKFGQVDLYSGYRAGEHGPAFDLRVALAGETVVNKEAVGPDYVLSMRREKLRRTYFFRAWKIDLSSVTTSFPKGADGSEPAPSMQSHEVELELDSYMLMQNLMAKHQGKQHKLWELLSDFLFAARDLLALVSEMQLPPSLPAALPFADPLGEAARHAYRESYGRDVPEPIVGHYLYSLATQGQSTRPPPVINRAISNLDVASGESVVAPPTPPAAPAPQLNKENVFDEEGGDVYGEDDEMSEDDMRVDVGRDAAMK